MKKALGLGFILVVILGIGLVLAQQPRYGTATFPVYAGGIEQQNEPPWVARIEGKLDSLIQLSKSAPPPTQETKDDPLVTAAGACATCHSPDVAKTEGGDFTFFQTADGGVNMIAPATLNEWRTLRRQIDSGKMPPPNNKKNIPALTPAQKSAMAGWMDQNKPAK